jgi:putative transposase
MSGPERSKKQHGYRASLRLQGYDYTSDGAYFITLCTTGKACHFGEVFNNQMHLSEIGHIVAESWAWLGEHYSYVTIDEYVLMPNHLHAIIVLHSPRRGGSRTAPTGKSIKRKPLGRLIGSFKTVSTKRVNQHLGTPGKILWQRNFYEHIIRNTDELDRIRNYILNNPMRWEIDRENPQCRREQT